MKRIFPTTLSDVIRTLILLIPLSVLISFILCYQIIHVKGTSMSPTLGNGDICLTQKICLQLDREDLIGFDVEIYGSNKSLVKRIIGLPGETIDVHSSCITIYRNNKGTSVIEEIYLDPQIKNPQPFSVTLGEDEYFVLGDNRQMSAGSVQFGPVKRSQIKFKFILTLFRSL